MAENPCAQFFRQYGNDSDFVTKLPAIDECVKWESLCASPDHSPGPVSDDEIVYRRIVNPTHIDDSNEPTPACFSDAWNKGLSLDRECRGEEASRDAAIAWVEAFNQNNPNARPKTFRGLAAAAVRDLRGLKTPGGKRAFAIFDTAVQSNPAHADLCALGQSTKQERKDLRVDLWRFFKGRLGIP